MKKVLSFILSGMIAVSALSAPVTAMAAEPDQHTFVCDTNSTAEIQPRLSYLSSVFTDISYGNGLFTCQGNYTTIKTNRVQLTVNLERSNDNSSWTRVQYWEKTYNPGTGQNVVPGYYWTTVPGYYRVRTVALVYGSSSSIVESVTVYSKTIKL